MTPSPRILIRRERRRDGVIWRVRKAVTFIDPFPWIAGTLPEKMVFAELAKRHVPFVFQADWWTEVTSKLDREQRFALLATKDVRPDFIVPVLKTVIEVQGEYWHSTPEAIAHDRAKAAVYRAFGFHVIPMWEADILRNVAAQVDRIPGIATSPNGAYKLGEHVGLGADSVAAMNRARRKPKAPTIRRRVARGRRR